MYKLRKISAQKPPASYAFPAMKSAINFGPEKIGSNNFEKFDFWLILTREPP